MKTLLTLILTLAAALGAAGAAWADGQKQVLVLYAVRRDAQLAVIGDRDLPRLLEQGLPQGIDYYSEYIDLPRSSDPDYQDGFRDFLAVKYRGIRFDLVIAVLDPALEFVRNTREELFPGTPIVFLSTSTTSPRIANGTGLVAPLRLVPSLELSAALQPAAKRIVVITGAGSVDQGYERMARAQLASLEPRFAISYVTGLPMAEIESRVAALNADAIVFFVMVYQDGAGANFHPLEALDRVVRASAAPVYSWVDSAMERGIVGGSLKDQVRQNEELAKVALKVLHGERADAIPVTTPPLQVSQVDWRQLRRWKISEANVPVGTIVKFREPTPWDRYQNYILGAASILLAQSALIAGLLVQRTRRRQAEQRIRDLGARLLQAQESERAHIARELHDDISQQMALLEIDMELLGGAVSGDAAGMADGVLQRAQGVAKSVHDLSHRLHPAKLRLMGLVPALRGLQRELSHAGLDITLSADHLPPNLAPELTLCLFRVVQEALQNAAKHSGATTAMVQLAYGAKGLTLTIADDGCGFETTRGWQKGLGLISMKERLEAIGGTLRVRSAPGKGTRVIAIVPPVALVDPAPLVGQAR
jgi:signal transduction histidine kinase